VYDAGDAADPAGCSRALDCDGMLIKVIVSVRTNFFLRETIFLGFLCVRLDFFDCLIGEIDGDLDFKRILGGDLESVTTLALARAGALSRM
jgi:hypothetical protein